MAAFTCRLTRPASTVRGVWSKTLDFSDPVYSAPVVPTSRLVRLDAPSLSPDTDYYYAAEVDGVLRRSRVGRIRTPPVPGTPASFTFWAASCASTGSEHPVFRWLRMQRPAFGIHMGDLHYEDIGVNDETIRRQAFDSVFLSRHQSALYREIATQYMWDDHDYGPNNSDRTMVGRDSSVRVYRQRVPVAPVESGSTDAVYFSFQYGRVVFIVTDLRSERDPQNTPDGPSKTMMGAAQKAWFKSVLTDPANEGKLFCWVSTSPWAYPNRVDSWTMFPNERDELSNFFADNDLARRLFIIEGDSHDAGVDFGTTTDFSDSGNAPLTLGRFAPLDRPPDNNNGSQFSEAYSGGRRGQVGMINIQDSGGDTIAVTLRAMRAVDGGATPPADVAFEEAFAATWQADVSAA